MSLSSIPSGIDVIFYSTSVYLKKGGMTLNAVRIDPLPGSIEVGKDIIINVEAKSPPYPSAKALLTLHGELAR